MKKKLFKIIVKLIKKYLYTTWCLAILKWKGDLSNTIFFELTTFILKFTLKDKLSKVNKKKIKLYFFLKKIFL